METISLGNEVVKGKRSRELKKGRIPKSRFSTEAVWTVVEAEWTDGETGIGGTGLVMPEGEASSPKR